MNELLFFGLFFALASMLLVLIRLGKVYVFAAVAVLAVLMNIFVLKPYNLFGITTYGGNALYGCIFFATDLLDEYYGRKEAMKAVKIGFLALLIYFVSSFVYLHIQPNLDVAGAAEVQSAFVTIFSFVPAIALASIVAFLISNTFDIYAYDFINKKTKGKHLWLRNNASTLTSQLIDTTIFTCIAAIFGIFAWSEIKEVIMFAYIFKVMIALLDTPFIYLSKLVMKNHEKIV